MALKPRRRLTGATLPLALLGLAACGDDDDGLRADAGDDFSVVVGAAPEFDGCSSQGEITDYRWVIREAPEGMAHDVDKPVRDSSSDCAVGLEAEMVVDEVGTWVVELIVTDTAGATSSDSVRVDVTG